MCVQNEASPLDERKDLLSIICRRGRRAECAEGVVSRTADETTELGKQTG